MASFGEIRERAISQSKRSEKNRNDPETKTVKSPVKSPLAPSPGKLSGGSTGENIGAGGVPGGVVLVPA
jgi:hypothetical protein